MTMQGVVTYYAYDMITGDLLAELPLSNVTFMTQLNAAGSWSGQINTSDLSIQDLDVITATRPGRTLLIIDVDGIATYAGIVWARTYEKGSSTLHVSGNEVLSYFDHRVQAADYTNPPTSGTFWNNSYGTIGGLPVAPTYMVGAQIVYDALQVSGSAFSSVFPITISINEAFSGSNLEYFSFPISQLQTVSNLIKTTSTGTYKTSLGYDFSIDVSWQDGLAGGTPVLTFNFSWPWRGTQFDTRENVFIDTSEVIDYSWPEDSTRQNNKIYVSMSSSSVPPYTTVSNTTTGYPLLESTSSSGSSGNSTSMASAEAYGMLNQFEYPILTPTFTLPMFGVNINPNDILTGDTIIINIEPDERFPNGLPVKESASYVYGRAVAITYSISDFGQSTMIVTLNLDPNYQEGIL